MHAAASPKPSTCPKWDIIQISQISIPPSRQPLHSAANKTNNSKLENSKSSHGASVQQKTVTVDVF